MNSPIMNRRDRRLAGVDTCTGCGTCSAVCPTQAIELTIDSRSGTYRPQVDNDRCCACGLCSNVCPGLNLDIDAIAQSLFDSKPRDLVIGNFERCYLAHAADYGIRYGSASGGLVTALLILALEEEIIDGALVTRMNRDAPLLPEPFIARTRADILSASTSKYCPVPANKAIRTILENEGRFAVVGLPCHLHGIRKAEIANENLGRKIGLHLGLFCSHSLDFHATRYLLKRTDVKLDDVANISYRGRGWPGGVTIRESNGTSHFTSIHNPVWGAIFESGFFTPKSCLWCADLTSELSDLSFGDPWLPETIKNERIGKSIVISRTQEGENLLKLARQEKKIDIEVIDANTVIASQTMFSHFKKKNVRARRQLGMRTRILPPLDHIRQRDNLMGRLTALIAVLNSSMGSNRLLRAALERIPVILLSRYSALLRIILVRSMRHR